MNHLVILIAFTVGFLFSMAITVHEFHVIEESITNYCGSTAK